MRKRILFVTQCFPCGSWLCIEKIAKELSNRKYRVDVLGLGTPSEKIKNFRYYLIPFFAYTRYGNITAYSPIFGFLWNLPLYFTALFLAFTRNPQVIIYNGLASGLVLSPFFRLIGKKNIIMYHTVIGNESEGLRIILKFLFRFVDLIVVNSKTSYGNLIDFVTDSKLVINEHYADDVFFKFSKSHQSSHKKLRVLYAGRIDKDKRCFPLIDFAKSVKNNPDFEFTFVGRGADVEKVASLPRSFPHIMYKGYIDDKAKLAELYSSSDVVWGFADTSYLGLPAVEALASNTPIIVPKYAAIAHKDTLIDPALVPSTIGWMVDPFKPKEIENLMHHIQENDEYLTKTPREFSSRHYSINNLWQTVTRIEDEIER